ncbi:hypothetical protein BGY98DRAFT_1018941 [Russula aff. rugulosa BPL654]|nr:hypothetical protein BGY98DRAFT_1018941 [Russula aff. rugulosa BPL654]
MSQGVDIQLKIFQTHLSVVTNFPAIHSKLLVNPLRLLHESPPDELQSITLPDTMTQALGPAARVTA